MDRAFKDTRSYAHFELGIRESMTVLPNWLQPFLTWLTGHAIDGQKPIVRIKPVPMLVVTIGSIFALITGATFVMQSWSSIFLWFPILIYWLVLTGLLRSLQLVYGHHAVHRAMSLDSRVNQICALLCSVIPLVMNENDYKDTHNSHHHYKTFCTTNDDDSKFLVKLGFRSGVSREKLWQRFLLALFNPFFHWTFLCARFRSNFTSNSAGIARKFASLICVCAIACYGALAGVNALIVCIIIPFFFLYNFSALINFMTEHSWMNDDGQVLSKMHYESKCWGRFCGQRYPRESGMWIKFLWWGAMFFLHLPVRVFALIGDVTVHDVHHLYGYPENRTDWIFDIYRRQDLMRTDTRNMKNRELWGLFKTVDSVFIGMCQIKPKEI